MKVSIITVSYNSAMTIRDTIESVVRQSYKNIEYIVIDGNSTDQTMDIVEEFGDNISTVVSENDNGIYDAMNKGVSLATGDIVGILNSDDFYEDNFVIEEVVKQFDDSCHLVFGDLFIVDGNNTSLIKRFYSIPKFKASWLRFGWMPPHPATFIRKNVYDAYGNYKTNYKIAADFEFFTRLLSAKKLEIKYLPKTLVRMRAGGVSTSGFSSSLRLNSEIISGCKENGVYTNWLFLLFKIPFKLYEFVKRPIS